MLENNDLNIEIKCCKCGATNCYIISARGSGCSNCENNSGCRFKDENALICYKCSNGHIFYKNIGFNQKNRISKTRYTRKFCKPNAKKRSVIAKWKNSYFKTKSANTFKRNF